jgi:hypothetical protein
MAMNKCNKGWATGDDKNQSQRFLAVSLFGVASSPLDERRAARDQN